jgi:hypothetical protein
VALLDQALLAEDPTFQKQVRMAALNYATVAILKAPVSGKGNRADEKIWKLAQDVLADGCLGDVQRFAYGLAAYPGFNFTPGEPPKANDADISSAIITAWPLLAGVTSADQNS